MSGDSSEIEMARATRKLVLINEQAEGLRAELVALRRHVAEAQQAHDELRGAQLLEANQHLVLAVLRAESIAETALNNLTELARSSQHEPRFRNLRDANEQLVLAALTAQELEAGAEEAHRRQITFLAMVAHELRNPLTPILQAAELLHRRRMDDPRLERLQGVIKRQVAHMARLIDDLLDRSRISTGKFRLERGTVEMAGILNLAIETCQPAMETRLQHFTLQPLPDALTVHGDAVRLAQIFSNLLDNASKYTPEGGEIALAAEVRDHTLTITVTDSGIGIPEEALPKIFDLFVQEARAVAVYGGGLGIGLAVVRELVEAHGGTVVARSAGTDRGSEFVVTLPMADGATVTWAD